MRITAQINFDSHRKSEDCRGWVKNHILDYEHGFSSGVSSLGLSDGMCNPTGSNVGFRKEGSDVFATAFKQTGVASQIAVLGHTISDKNIRPEVSILGLGDEDFPPLLPFSDLSTNKNTSKSVDASVQARTGFEVKQVDASLGSTPTKSDKEVLGRRSRGTAAIFPSEDAKGSHNWRSLFVKQPKSCSSLVFTNPSTVDGKVIINPPLEAVVEGVGIWEGCLVGQFFGKRLPLHVVKSLVARLLGKHEIPEISTTDNGLFIFRFRDPDARGWVLESGPWYLAGRPIILRIWKPGMEMLNVQITSLPIWVEFFNIPLEYWTVTSLGYIASAVGIPIHLDTLT